MESVGDGVAGLFADVGSARGGGSGSGIVHSCDDFL